MFLFGFEFHVGDYDKGWRNGDFTREDQRRKLDFISGYGAEEIPIMSDRRRSWVCAEGYQRLGRERSDSGSDEFEPWPLGVTEKFDGEGAEFEAGQQIPI